MQIVLPHSKPLLSVLICHLPERGVVLNRLLSQLYLQVNDHPVEIIINEGEGATGAKRNELIAKAQGEYVVFCDDDDEISDNYLDRIIPYLDGNNSAVGFVMEFRFGKHIIPMICCNAVVKNKQYREVIFKTITHCQPIKKELCVPFRHITKGEDVFFNREMAEILKDKRCAFIYETLYYYNCH